MILPFSTQLNGKPTYFVEKIWRSLFPIMLPPQDWLPLIIECEKRQLIPKGGCAKECLQDVKPKFHTIRDDVNGRWHKGRMIDFFINCRQKDMFRFAPRIPVVSTQEVFMTYAFNDVIEIIVDDVYLNDTLAFAQNDGFDNWEDFFNFFYPKIKANPDLFYKGKIIHWTELRY